MLFLSIKNIVTLSIIVNFINDRLFIYFFNVTIFITLPFYCYSIIQYNSEHDIFYFYSFDKHDFSRLNVSITYGR